MGPWAILARSIEEISDQDLENSLKQIDSVGYRTITYKKYSPHYGFNDVSTFEAFRDASASQVGILLNRFPEILNDLGHYFAMVGKFEMVNYLIDKGCNLNSIAFGTIKGFRHLETRCLENETLLMQKHKYCDLMKKYYNTMYETTYETSLSFLNKLIEKGIDKEQIYSNVLKTIYATVFFQFNKEDLVQTEIFYKSGTCKAYIKSLELLDTGKSLRSELLDIIQDEFIGEVNKENFVKHFFAITLDLYDSVEDRQKIIDQIAAEPINLVNQVLLLAENEWQQIQIPDLDNAQNYSANEEKGTSNNFVGLNDLLDCNSA